MNPNQPNTVDLGPAVAQAASYYAGRYAMIAMLIQPGKKRTLEYEAPLSCRFCRRAEPEASFRHQAHAIPESLGNKTILSRHECDDCNDFFGAGIETELGKWSKPARTLARISGANGVPTLKREGPDGYRIEHKGPTLHLSHYEKHPTFFVDEKAKTLRFELKRDRYIPAAVYKALVKIALTMMPATEIENFQEALQWIRDTDHSRKLFEAPVYYRFQPGPMRGDLIYFSLLRRKTGVTDVPYAFMVLAYGNDLLQVPLPSPKQDMAIHGKELSFPPFQLPNPFDPAVYGTPRSAMLDLSSHEPRKDDILEVSFHFDDIELKT